MVEVADVRYRSPVLNSREKIAVYLCLAIFFTIAMSLMMAPIFLGAMQCPADVIKSVSTAPIAECMSIFGLCTVCGTLIVIRYGRIIPVPGTRLFVSAPTRGSHRLFIKIQLGLFMAAVVLCLNGIKTFDCVMPYGLASRSGVFRKITEKPWAELASITAECSLIGKNNMKTGGVKLRFQDQSSFYVPLNPFDIAHNISDVLRIQPVSKRVSSSVVEERCPEYLLRYFEQWRF